MRLILALWLAIAPACAQEPIIGSGVYVSKSTAAAYTGPGDIVSGATFAVLLRAYTAAIASAGTQKVINIRNTGTNETCDILVATGGGLVSTVTNCSGSSNGTAYTTFCSGGCAVPKWYDQSGNSNDASNATAANQMTFSTSCVNSLPCVQGANNNNISLATGSVAWSAAPYTFVSVAERTGNTSSLNNIITLNSAVQLLFNSSVNSVATFCGSTGSTSGNDNTWHSIQGKCAAGGDIISVDGSNSSVTSGSNSPGTGAAVIAGRGVSAQPFVGNTTEIMVYPSGFSNANNTSMCKNEQSFYGSGNFGAVC